MPEKRPEVTVQPDPSDVLPEDTKRRGPKKRRGASSSSENDKPGPSSALAKVDDMETRLDRAEDEHEKAKRRKHSRTSH